MVEVIELLAKRLFRSPATFFCFAILSLPLAAETRIAVLEFDLKDVTLTANTPQEIERTASIKPLLEGA